MTPRNTCWICPEPATGMRLPTNPPFGISPDSGRPLTELQFLANMPDHAVPTCIDHQRVRLVDGKPAPVRAKTTESGKQNYAQRRKAQRLLVRTELIALLGGECKQCRTTDAGLLCISVRTGLWADLGIPDRTKRLEWLLQRPDHALLLCVDHIVTYSTLTPSTITHRDLVHEAYGGKCRSCGSTDRLCVVPDPATPVLRWPGGRKYNSTQKCAWLVRNGYPAGWSLVCPSDLNRKR